jgi:hypothetical protein
MGSAGPTVGWIAFEPGRAKFQKNLQSGLTTAGFRRILFDDNASEIRDVRKDDHDCRLMLS